LALAWCHLLQACKRHGNPSDHGDIVVERPACVLDLVPAADQRHLSPCPVGSAEERYEIREDLPTARPVDCDEVEVAGTRGPLDPFLKTSSEPFFAEACTEVADEPVEKVAVEPL